MGASLSKQLLLWLLRVSFMHNPYLKRSQSDLNLACTICTVSEQPAIDGCCCDKQEVRCHVCLTLSHLHYSCQCCTLAVGQRCPSLLEATNKWMRTFNFWEIFKRAFKIYGIWPQASTLRTHFRNAVPLVWGSLRLAPIINSVCNFCN